MDRLRNMLREFSARFSDIDAIYRRVLVEEHRIVPKTWWKRLWNKLSKRYTTDASRILNFMTTLDESEVIDITSSALGKMSVTHRELKELYVLEQNDAADKRHTFSASSGVLNSTDVVQDKPFVEDSQLNIDFSSTQFPIAHDQAGASHAQVKSVNECGPENTSAPVLVERPNSSGCLSRSRNALSDQDNCIELHEVIVHGSKPSSGVKHDRDHLKAAAVHHDSVNDKKDAVSKLTSSGDICETETIKIIGASTALRTKGLIAKLSMRAAQSPVGTVNIDDYVGKSSQVRAMNDDSVQPQTCPTDQKFDVVAVNQTCLPAPPPRSRSSSRKKSTNSCNSNVASTNEEFREQPPPSSMMGQAVKQPLLTTALPANHSASSLSQNQASDPPKLIDNQIIGKHEISSVPRRKKLVVATRAVHEQRMLDDNAAVGSTPAEVGLCDESGQQAAEPIRSRSHSRAKTDAASSRASVTSVSVLAPTKMYTENAHVATTVAISHLPNGNVATISHPARTKVPAPSLMIGATYQAAALAAKRSSGKLSPIQQPSESWNLRVQKFKNQFGDKFEEC
jgi:hypothetical protein